VHLGQLGLLGPLVLKDRPVHLDLEETLELLAHQVKEEMLDLQDRKVPLDKWDSRVRLVLQVPKEQLVILVNKDHQVIVCMFC